MARGPLSLRRLVAWAPWFVTQTPGGRALLATVLVWLAIFGLCKERLWRDPHSAYFQDAKVYDLGYSALRQAEARDFIHDADVAGRLPKHSDANRSAPLICVAMTTFRRHDHQYLNESLGSLLVGLEPEERDTLDVRLLFAHTDPTGHPDWDKPWLQAVDSWGGYNLSRDKMASLRQLEADEGFQTKGIIDYTYLLEDCLAATDAPFIAMFEDDIIFAEGWLLRTLSALEELSYKTQAWLYLRLFYTETQLFWDPETDFWYAHMGLTIGLAISVAFVLLTAARRALPSTRSHLDNWTICILALFTVPAFVALVFMAGKYNIMPLQGVEPMDRGGCCTQALIFPRAQVPALVSMLRDRETGQTDLIMEEYADYTGLKRYALAPQVVQHVGLISSRGGAEMASKSTWAFWFEAYRRDRLKQERDRLARAGIVRRLRRHFSLYTER